MKNERYVELSPSQVKEFKHGATVLLFPVKDAEKFHFHGGSVDDVNYYKKCSNRWSFSDFITDFSPIQWGDKNILIKEEFYKNENTFYKADGWGDHLIYEPASNLQEDDIRFKIDKCVCVSLRRIRKITPSLFIAGGLLTDFEFMEEGWALLKKRIDAHLKDIGSECTYEDDGYLFVVEVLPMQPMQPKHPKTDIEILHDVQCNLPNEHCTILQDMEL